MISTNSKTNKQIITSICCKANVGYNILGVQLTHLQVQFIPYRPQGDPRDPSFIHEKVCL